MRTQLAESPSLDAAVEALRARGLELRRGSEAPAATPAPSSLPTGHPALDAALGTGGWPRGALASLVAPAGSGATTLALGSLAACQGHGGLAAWVDVPGTFDPAVAARLGMELPWLLVACPRDPEEAIELAAWLGRGGLIDAFVLDLGVGHGARFRSALDRLAALLARSGGVGLLLGGSAAEAASVRIGLARQAWLAVGADLVGQRVRARVERNRWGLAGAAAELDLWFGEGRRIDEVLVASAAPQPVDAERPAMQIVGGAGA